MLYFIISIICVALLILNMEKITSIFARKETFVKVVSSPKKKIITKPVPKFYLGQPTKCFSCEQELPDKFKYLGGPTKCFSCERDLIKRYGHPYGSLGHATKCFSCESQMGKKPFVRI